RGHRPRRGEPGEGRGTRRRGVRPRGGGGAVRRDPRARRRRRARSRPRAARDRRPARRDRRRRRRARRGRLPPADDAPRPNLRLDAPRTAARGEGARRPPARASRAPARRHRPRARAGRGDLPARRGRSGLRAVRGGREVREARARAVTRRRGTYRSLRSLQRDNRVCRACLEAGYPLESWPVLEGRPGQRAYLFGQAPGAVEGQERRPWRGRAGQTLRRWLELDERAFYDTFYCASVTRCYPGKAPSGRGDRTPTPAEQRLCSLWRDWELAIIRPRLVVTVGGLAARALLGMKTVEECVGNRYELPSGAVAVPLPHPSGASGWLNSPRNRERVVVAAALIRAELARIP